MDGEAVNAIINEAKAPCEIGGFLLRPNGWTVEDYAALVKPGPTAAALAVSTLGAVRDYLTANKDALETGTLVVHVASPSSVRVYGPLDTRTRAREAYVAATAADLLDGFIGTFMSIETMIVGLQTRFANDPGDDRAKLLALIGNIKSQSTIGATDDGVTQTVEAKTGIVMVERAGVPNPILLTPYRTFRDVVQPSVLFVVRVQKSQRSDLPEVGLFEADGGAWRLSSIARVKDWLTAALPDVSVLA